MRQLLKGCSKIAFIGIGGGGDVCSAAMLSIASEREGLESITGTIVWERFPYDPIPGPIPLGSIRGIRLVSEYSGICEGECYANRNERKVEVQASLVSKALGRPILLLDISRGFKGLVEGVKALKESFYVDCVVGVDVGGDVLAEGGEDDLWSPLADSLGLSSIAKASSSGLRTFLAVHSLGADGELRVDYLLWRLSLIAREGGFYGSRGITRDDVEVLERVLSLARSEASMIQVLAFKGEHGTRNIRGGRSVEVTLLQTITFFVDATVAFRLSPLAQLVVDTESIWEARAKLNNAGVFTELDLEELVFKAVEEGTPPSSINIIALRELGKKRLREALHQ
uniref:DUF1152 domain-containing protein n=1 Tax=Fervidicoccus fontis TaxID=683846 RepID=A0A7J3ZLI8_9CREN